MAREVAGGSEATGWEPGTRFRARQGPTLLTLYFDTSALIKLVLDEQGSDLALELWSSSARAASSLLAYPEGRAALAAARRGGRVSQRLYRESQEGFDRTYEELVAIGVDQQLIHAAGDLASEFSLRGYDAVHLATALDLAKHDVALVSWDRDLGRAATAAGLPVLGEDLDP